jgi:hypothetical protein
VFGEPLNLSLQTYIKSDNGEKGIVIEYHDNSWTSPPNSNELQRYKLPLLNYPNPSLKIDPNFGKANWLLHFEPMQLSEGKIINLFDNLTAISIDLSRLNWRSTFKDKAHKLINISFLVENDRGQSYRAQIKQTRDGDSYIPPQKLTFFVTNDISNQNLKFVVIAKYGDENGRLIQGKKEFDSLSKLMELN